MDAYGPADSVCPPDASTVPHVLGAAGGGAVPGRGRTPASLEVFRAQAPRRGDASAEMAQRRDELLGKASGRAVNRCWASRTFVTLESRSPYPQVLRTPTCVISKLNSKRPRAAGRRPGYRKPMAC